MSRKSHQHASARSRRLRSRGPRIIYPMSEASFETGRRSRPLTRAQKVALTVVLTVVVPAFVVIEMTPYLGRGLYALLGPAPVQVGCGVAYDLVMVALAVGYVRAQARAKADREYLVPGWLPVSFGGLGALMWLLAPFGRFHSGSSAAAVLAWPLLGTLYLGYPMIGVAAWVTSRLASRSRRSADPVPGPLPDLHHGSDAARASLPRAVRRRRFLIGAAIPLGVVGVLMVLGAVVPAGPAPTEPARSAAAWPTRSPVAIRHLSIPQLVSSALEPTAAGATLHADAAVVPGVLARTVTGVTPARIDELAMWCRAGVAADCVVYVTVDTLPPDADLSAVAHHLSVAPAASDSPVTGWAFLTGQDLPTAVRLIGAHLLVVRLAGPGPHAPAHALQAVLSTLSPVQLQAIVDAATSP